LPINASMPSAAIENALIVVEGVEVADDRFGCSAARTAGDQHDGQARRCNG
jgi:hypothetical protein